MSAEQYDKLCKNKDTKIHMPKMKVDEETDIITFSDEEMNILSEYFTGTNAETAFMLTAGTPPENIVLIRIMLF